ncbi:hypothetical protein HZA86_00020 [Candidatus Uhrbacteria bacterium]|nr:hypothetical protein [Candidatus Uhrbacteria bacterium]
MPHPEAVDASHEQNQRPRLGGGTRAIAQRNTGDLAAAIRMTEAVLAKQREVNPCDAEAMYAEVSGHLEKLTAQRTAAKQSEMEERLQYFIHQGRRALETELQYIEGDLTLSPAEKERHTLQTLREYADAKLVQKQAVLRVNESLLDRFLNPYATLDQLANLTESRTNQNGLWSSDFNPDSVERGLAQFISRPVLEEIRAGIQLALQMRAGVATLIQEHTGYNGRPDARAILKSVTGVEINGQSRVVSAGPLSITIVVLDSKDYAAVHGGDNSSAELSGGFHKNYLNTWVANRGFGQQYTALPFETRGLLNICKGYESAGTTDHENEHSLYEILIKNRGERSHVVQSLIAHLPQVPKTEHERLIESMFQELLFEARDRYITGFANEAMAYILNNESPKSPIAGVVESTVRRLTESKLYSHHHLTDAVISEIQSELLQQATILKESGVHPELVATYEKKVRELTRERLMSVYTSIATTMAGLHRDYPTRKNYIRAVLAGENPARWQHIAKVMANYQRIGGDTLTKKREAILAHEKWSLKDQQDAVWAFIDTLTRQESGNTLEQAQRSNVVYQFKEDEKLWESLSMGEKKFFVVRSPTGVRVVAAHDGRDVFGYEIPTDKFLSEDDCLLANGRLIVKAKIRTKGGGGKTVLLAEGTPRPIGLEYAQIDYPVESAGRLFFCAKLDNDMWQVINETGERIGSPYRDRPQLQNVAGHFYINGKEKSRYYLRNEHGDLIGPHEGSADSLTLLATDNDVFVESATRVFRSDGAPLGLPDTDRIDAACATARGLIVVTEQYKNKKIERTVVFTESWKRLPCSRAIIRNQDTKRPYVEITHDGQKRIVDDHGEDIIAPSMGGFTVGSDVVYTTDNGSYLYSIKGATREESVYTREGGCIASGDIQTLPNGKGGNRNEVAALAIRQSDGTQKIVDTQGNLIATISGMGMIDNYFLYEGNAYVVGQMDTDGKWGCIDAYNKIVIDGCDAIPGIENGCLLVEKDHQLKRHPLGTVRATS